MVANTAVDHCTIVVSQRQRCARREFEKHINNSIPSIFEMHNLQVGLSSLDFQSPIQIADFEMDTQICPHEGRRSTVEMISKLGVIHFTTIASFAHLLSLRGERNIPSKIVIFFLCPYLIWAQYGLALFTLAIGHIVVPFKGNPDSLNKSLQRGQTLLFGHIDDAPVPNSRQLAAAWPRNIDRGNTRDTRKGTAKERSQWKFFGRILVALFFLVQCVGSVVLYARRERHDAVAVIDQRVMGLAAGGLLVAILTLTHLIWKPKLTEDDISGMAHVRTYLDVALLQILNLPEKPHRVSKHSIGDQLDDVEIILESPLSEAPRARNIATTGFARFMISSAMSSILLCSFELNYARAMWRMFKWIATEGPTTPRRLFLVFVSLVVLMLMRVAFPSRLPRCTCLSLMAIPLNAMAFTLFLLLALSPLLNILIVIMQVFLIAVELDEFAQWPTEKACPWLWQDPASSFIWSL